MTFPSMRIISGSPVRGRWRELALALWLVVGGAFAGVEKSGSEAADALVLFSVQRPPPVLDGALEELSWREVQRASGFLSVQRVTPATAQTEVMSCYDQEKLYLAARMNEPELSKLKTNHLPWKGDSVEFWLNPDNQGEIYYQLIVGAGGEVAFFKHSRGSPVELPFEPGVAKVSKAREGVWSCELAIPFSLLGTLPPSDNARWGLGLHRARHTVAPPELSSWSALADFSRKESFGKLAFYSQDIVPADLAYWEKNDHDPLLRRQVVSGYDYARKRQGESRRSTLWHYDPFSIDREKGRFRGKSYRGLRGISEGSAMRSLKDDHPEVFEAAMSFNHTLIAYAKAHEALLQLRKVSFYRAESEPMEEFERLAEDLERALKEAYDAYAEAFFLEDAGKRMEGLTARLKRKKGEIEAFHHKVIRQLELWQAAAKEVQPWEVPTLRYRPGGESERRISYAGMRFLGDEAFARELLPLEWGSVNIDGANTRPRLKAPDDLSYPVLDRLLDRIVHGSVGRPNLLSFFSTVDFSLPLSETMEARLAEDRSIAATSQDGLQASPQALTSRYPGSRELVGVNIHHPEVSKWMTTMATSMAAYVSARQSVHFFVTGWEVVPYLKISDPPPGTPHRRTAGYDPYSVKAFQAYLKERYHAIADLNEHWGSAYPDFSSIDPPPDKFLHPRKEGSALGYEWERWGRLSRVRMERDLGRALRQGAPEVPLMIDHNRMFAGGNLYDYFREDVADFYSYHNNPLVEDAWWTFLGSLARRYHKAMAYFENYWLMYTRANMADERLAKRDLRKFFFLLWARGVTLPTFWLNHTDKPTPYVVAYGGGFFNLDFDQTLLRWCSTELHVEHERMRRVEKVWTQTQRLKPQIAILQPCSTVYQLLAKDGVYTDANPPLVQAVEIHNTILRPGNYEEDYITEEMIEDGAAALKEYKVLFLPYALYLSQELSQKLELWVREGGVLIALGPFGWYDRYGKPMKGLMQQAFPDIKRVGSNDWDYRLQRESGPALHQQEWGKGRLLYLDHPLELYQSRSPESLRRLQEMVGEALPQLVRVSDANVMVQLREGETGERFLLLSQRHEKERLEVTVSYQGVLREALDVMVPAGYPVAMRRKGPSMVFDIALDGGDYTVIYLKSDQVAQKGELQ